MCGGSRAVAWFWSWPCIARNVPPCSGVVSVEDIWYGGAALAAMCLLAHCTGVGTQIRLGVELGNVTLARWFGITA